MNSSSPTNYDETSYRQQVEIDDICDRFEAQLKTGGRPAADEFLRLCDSHSRGVLVSELLKLELDYRRDEATAVREEYELRFPELAHVILMTPTKTERRLEPGTTWGNFRIERQIGAGGMGIVYQAYDTKLERIVALKFLPSKFGLNRERLRRFEREAKILASLNHPNIATLYNLEEHEGTRCLVLELIQGDTLSQMLGRRRLTPRELTAVFSQIALALESAHEAGVIHRDLKPSNVMITSDGVVKVLDFGLARSFSGLRQLEQVQASDSPEPASKGEQDRASNIGVSGTLAYMSPEQVQGETVDKRCDVWAFGCCLFEALSGQRAFSQQTPESLLRAIVEHDPVWKLLPSEIPDSIMRLLRRCLAKDSRQRLRDLGDARIELEDYLRELSTTAPQVALRPKKAISLRFIALPLVAVLVVAAMILPMFWPKADISRPEFRFTVPLPRGLEVADSPALAMSPDGRYLAYVTSDQDDNTRLFIRPANSVETNVLAGTDGASQPFFSPDSRTIGFFADHSLKTVSVSGGQPVLMCDAPHPKGAYWSKDGRIVFGFNWGQALDSIAPDGTDRRKLGRAGDAYIYCWPQLLPDGNSLVFGCGKVMMAHLDQLEASDGELTSPNQYTELIPRGSFVRYLNHHLIYGHRGTLHAVPLKLNPPRVVGNSTPVADDLWTSALGSAQFAVSESGHLAYVAGKAMEEGQLVWKSRTNHSTKPAWPADGYQVYESFRLSPDGKRLAIGKLGSEGYDIWIYDFEAETGSTLGLEGETRRPIWSQDGKCLVFLWDDGRQPGLCMKELDTSKTPELLVQTSFRQSPVWLSRDGKRLIFCRTTPDSADEILELDLQSRTEQPLLTSNKAYGSLSPDENWMVYTATGTTRETQVYACRYPPQDEAPIRISDEAGGLDPMWSPADSEIFYLSGDGNWLMSAILAREAVTFDKPRRVFSARSFLNIPGYSFDYDSRAERFLLVQKKEDNSPKREIRLILNWSG